MLLNYQHCTKQRSMAALVSDQHPLLKTDVVLPAKNS